MLLSRHVFKSTLAALTNSLYYYSGMRSYLSRATKNIIYFLIIKQCAFPSLDCDLLNIAHVLPAYLVVVASNSDAISCTVVSVVNFDIANGGREI